MADVVTTVGKNAVAEKIGGLGTNADFTFLHLGSVGTTASTADTQLAAAFTDSGLEAAGATVSTDTANVLQLVHIWTASATKTIRECGVSNTDTTGGADTLLARSDFGTISVDSDDSLQITYRITVS
jgi:hypothetical protein